MSNTKMFDQLKACEAAETLLGRLMSHTHGKDYEVVVARECAVAHERRFWADMLREGAQ